MKQEVEVDWLIFVNWEMLEMLFGKLGEKSKGSELEKKKRTAGRTVGQCSASSRGLNVTLWTKHFIFNTTVCSNEPKPNQRKSIQTLIQ